MGFIEKTMTQKNHFEMGLLGSPQNFDATQPCALGMLRHTTEITNKKYKK